MPTLQEAAEDFLSRRRIAVVGVPRDKGQAANFIYRKLRQCGYEVFPVNPNAATVEQDRCFPRLREIPGGVEAAVVATHPERTSEVVRDCVDCGIRRVWLHRSFGRGSVTEEAVRLGRERGLTVIAGGCPMMFCRPVDLGHRCMRWVLSFTGGLPKEVREP